MEWLWLFLFIPGLILLCDCLDKGKGIFSLIKPKTCFLFIMNFITKNIFQKIQFQGDLPTSYGVAGGSVELPCNTSAANKENYPMLVMWFKDNNLNPFYRYMLLSYRL